MIVRSKKLFMVETRGSCYEFEGRSDTVLVVRIEREIGWCKLQGRGPKCIAGLRTLVEIITYPAHAKD